MKKANQTNDRGGVTRRSMQFLKTPSSRYSVGFLTVTGIVLGILLWVGFNWTVDVTNREEFCISCHEMEVTVYQEYKYSRHYNNASGVRATCPDCHVPKEWYSMLVHKVIASKELIHKALGSIDTPEKFEAKRLELAQRVWDSMEKTDSRECRNCHDDMSMDYFAQDPRAVEEHIRGFNEGKTCIECHQGLTHSLPAGYEVDKGVVAGIVAGN